MSKDFRGKAGMEALAVRAKCVTVLIDGPEYADPWGREALVLDGQKVGRLTSGGYSVHFGKQIGIGYGPAGPRRHGPEVAGTDAVRALEGPRSSEDSPYDPKNATIRADG